MVSGFSSRMIVQGPSGGESILDACGAGAKLGAFSRLRGHFAYASKKGVVLMQDVLRQTMTRWSRVEKRWLVSFDYGFSDPDALQLLRQQPCSEVRVLRGEEVIARQLMPVSPFHSKSLVLDAKVAELPVMTLVGSGNLTESGLCCGYEQACLTVWGRQVDGAALAAVRQLRTQIDQMDEIFEDSCPLTGALLKKYSALHQKKGKRPPDSREGLEALVPTESGVSSDVRPAEGVRMARARFFWVDIDYVVPNRGKVAPGNQIDLRRGSRVFFGFSAVTVPKNTGFGDVDVVCHGLVEPCALRFGNNSMDKMNLPKPEDIGVDAYVGKTICFERVGERRFRMSVVDRENAAVWKGKSEQQGGAFRMSGGRAYGVFN